MITRELVPELSNDRRRIFRVLDGDVEVGTDVETIPTVAETNGRTLQDRARAALAANATFLAIPSPGPSNAQVITQVKALTRECSALIRLLLGQTDTTDGT